MRSVDWIFIVGAPAWRWLGEYVTVNKTSHSLDRASWYTCVIRTTEINLKKKVHLVGPYSANWTKFYSLLFKQEAVAVPVTATTFCLIAFLEEAVIRNIIIILCINHIHIISVNNNTAVFKNNYGCLQDLKIPMGTRKDFFEIYTQFGHAPSKKVRRPCST